MVEEWTHTPKPMLMLSEGTTKNMLKQEHKIADLVYSNSTGLGMIKRIDSENNGGYPYVIEWFEDLAKDYITSPSYHNSQEIEYFKKGLLAYIQSRDEKDGTQNR